VDTGTCILKFLNPFINWLQIEWQLNDRKNDPLIN